MADPRFFTAAGPFALAQIAERCGAELGPNADPERLARDVAPLADAGPEDVSFLDNRKYLPALAESRAGACILHPDLADRAPPGMALLLSKAPYKAYALAAQAFYPIPAPRADIHPSAVVDLSAVIGDGVEIGPGAVVGARAEIGAGCRIGPNAVIGEGVVVGDGSVVGACASLSHCVIGKRTTIYPGARIGQDGFGFAMDPKGHVRVPQLGRVIVGDDVEIGANATVDRGAGPDTVIGDGVMIDNLVQIGHNVEIGPRSVIIAQAGIAGSTKLDALVVVAAQAGLTGHLKIGAGARIAAQSGVMRDIGPGEEVGGSPAVGFRQWLRQTATLAKLARKGKGE